MKQGGLRKRWILNTMSVLCVAGLICALIVVAAFATYYYSSTESDLRGRASTVSDYLAQDSKGRLEDYRQACMEFASSFDNKNQLELQFIDPQGNLLASSYSTVNLPKINAEDVLDALSNREISDFRGKDSVTGERIMAVSSPMIFRDGQIAGVMRYVVSTRGIDLQILKVLFWSLAAVAIVATVVLLCSNYYVRSILLPVAEITEKAKKIAAGGYGIQIDRSYDDEIGELADTINELSYKINQNEIMQREFISSLSHELRTPLTAITGWTETILGDDSLDPETLRGMHIISKEGKRLTGMVVELLDFNRMQDGKLTLNMEEADIRGEFEETVFMYSSGLSQESIELNYIDCDEDIPEISCDLKRLRQVFLNILDNAAKHGGSGGKIDASMDLDETSVIFRIRDYGPGIAEDELPLVKKKFYKGSSNARGTGIGLAVCDEIVALHGGSLDLNNAEGGGTVVTIRLPISQ